MLAQHATTTAMPCLPRRPLWRRARATIAYLAGFTFLVATGCGTTRWTNSPRTATEMLLVSNAIDRAVDQMDFRPLAGERVYFDPQYLTGVLDQQYVVSSLRQKLLASGCVLTETRSDARFVVEARSGGVGTDQNDLTFGVPSVNIPPILGSIGSVPASIPEVPFIKKTAQKGLAKLAVFAYDRETGQAVWQSGAEPASSTAQHTWILGAGPFQRGTIYEGPKFAGTRLPVPRTLHEPGQAHPQDEEAVSVTESAIFLRQSEEADPVQLADHQQPADEPPVTRDEPKPRRPDGAK